MKNNSFIFISAGKLAEIIQESCPPGMYTGHNKCLIGDVNGCHKCWLSWLKDGE